MKTKHFFIPLFYIWLATSLCGCSNDDEPTATTTEGSVLTVLATTEDFRSGDGAVTRAEDEDGYKTKFSNGDRIGVFAVKADGSVMSGCNNLPLTYNGTGWTGTVYYYSGVEYFAYYPYNKDLDASITTLDAIVDGFTPLQDQSNGNYTKSDLMTAEAVSPVNNRITFSFTHAMSLIEISLPTVLYKFKAEQSLPDYQPKLAGNPQFNDFTPYTVKENFIYRYLVKPGTGCTLKGEYTDLDSREMTYTLNIAAGDLSASKYKRYLVDGGAISVTDYELQMGDFYMKNGSLLKGTESLTETQKSNCIGVVMKVGKHETDDCQYKTKGGKPMTDIHGYVLATGDINIHPWGPKGTSIIAVQEDASSNTFYGYKFTQIIKDYATGNGMDLQTAFPIFYYNTVDYEKTYPALESSSGWYLPSIGQCKYWLDNKATLLESIKKVNSRQQDFFYNAYYWSSTEYNNTDGMMLRMDQNSIYGADKNYYNPAFSMLTF